MSGLLTGWRVSLRRTRADWPIVGAAWLITILAAVLLAAGAIYPAAASEAGLRRALGDAPAGQTGIVVSVYRPADQAAAIDPPVESDLQALIGNLGGTIERDWRGSTTLALDGLPGSVKGDQALVGYLDDIAGHATLVDGAWPAAAQPGGPIQVVVLDSVARTLGLKVGDAVPFVAHPSENPQAVPATLVGIVSVTTPADPYWGGDAQLTNGIRDNGSYRTFGPFLTTQADLLANAGMPQISLQWRVLPQFDRLTVDDAATFLAQVDVLGERLGVDTGQQLTVTTGLSAILSDAERSLLVSRTGVLLLMAQLSILAAYAVVLTASLLVDHRRIDTALLRSRGAGLRQIALLGTAEGLLLAVPAVLVAPWLAVGALDLLNVAGPLAAVDLGIVPRVSFEAYVAAGAAGIAAIVLLVVPSVLAARGYAAEQSTLSRQETRTFGQRLGLDVALLALTGIAVWQLRLYGAPLTRNVQGTLGLDPLLVAAPAIGLIAGAILALRLLPLLAQIAEAAISRGRDLVASLGSRQLSRRPLRYTRSALLLILALSMGVFALSYAATWSSSQADQAAYQVGSDVRVAPGRTIGGLPAWAEPAAYRALPGITGTLPVEHIADGIAFAAAGSSDLLALDAATASTIVHMRPDEAAQPLADLLAPLVRGRPAIAPPTLPPGTTFLQVTPSADIQMASQAIFDASTGNENDVPLDPKHLTGVQVRVGATVMDRNGLLYDVQSAIQSVSGGTATVILSLEPSTDRRGGAAPAGANLDGPLSLVGLGIVVWLPQDVFVSSGTFGVAAVAAGSSSNGPWADVSLATPNGWSSKAAQSTDVFPPGPGTPTAVTDAVIGGSSDQGGIPIYGSGLQRAAGHFSFVAAGIAPVGKAVPVIANTALLASLQTSAGETISASIDGATRRLQIAGVVDSFPTTDPSKPLLIFDEMTLGLLRLDATGAARNTDEWWLATSDGASADSAAATLRSSPFDSLSVVSLPDRTRDLSTDPVALGIIGALTLGFVATGLFAIVGLTVSAAVSARQRRTEFALLRALGLSGRQLSLTLWLENGSLVVISLLAGTGLGLLIAWLVLPFVTVTQKAAAPVPPVLVEVPWDRILLLDATSAVALGIAVIVIGWVLRRIGVGSVLRMGED